MVKCVKNQPYGQTALISTIRGTIFKRSKTSISTVYTDFFKSSATDFPDEKEISVPIMALTATAVRI
jgi:hypothetical protein